MTRSLRPCSSCVLLALALFAIAGCSGDDDSQAGPNAPAYRLPFPDTPDQLIANFQIALTTLDLAAYRDEILADRYEFILQGPTVQEFGLPDGVFDRVEELAIVQRMFTGQPNEAGKVLTAIEVQSLQPHGPWLEVPQADVYFRDLPGALVRNYDLVIYFHLQDDSRYEVRGQQLFYATPDVRLFEGAMTQCYRLRGQLDACTLSSRDQTEMMTWGAVKAHFR